MRRGLGILAVLLIPAVLVATPVEKIEVHLVTTLGADAAYFANDPGGPGDQGDLNWSGGSTAYVYYEGALTPLEVQVTVTGLWSQCTDTSGTPGYQIPEASAIFASGGFTLNFAYAGVPVGSMTASLAPGHLYVEGETSANFLYGTAFITVDDFELVEGAQEYGWQGDIGDLAGVMVSTFVPTNNPDLQTYTENWASDNCLITVLADESFIPEPATLLFLVLGGSALVARRRLRR